MSATGTTTNYALPQYIGSDKVNILSDFNNMCFKVDEAMHGAEVKAKHSEEVSSAASALVTTLNTLIGSDPLSVSTTIVNAINTLNTMLQQRNVYIAEVLPEVVDRNEKMMYLKVTSTLNPGVSDTIQVSPTMGIELQ